MTKEVNDPCPEIQSILSPASSSTRGRDFSATPLIYKVLQEHNS
ncbi:hypothetical protein H5410_044719, partial [Solanum commersonii]